MLTKNAKYSGRAWNGNILHQCNGCGKSYMTSARKGPFTCSKDCRLIVKEGAAERVEAYLNKTSEAYKMAPGIKKKPYIKDKIVFK
jgi:endogenous inhibitor of DNA gyrase (YacG/DUF329 family)